MKKADYSVIEKAIKNNFCVTVIVREGDSSNVQSFDARSESGVEDAAKYALGFAQVGKRCMVLIPETLSDVRIHCERNDPLDLMYNLSLRNLGGAQRTADLFFVQKGMHNDAVMAFALDQDGYNKPLNQVLAECAKIDSNNLEIQWRKTVLQQISCDWNHFRCYDLENDPQCAGITVLVPVKSEDLKESLLVMVKVQDFLFKNRLRFYY